MAWSLHKSLREIIDAELEEIDLPPGDTAVNNPGAATPDPAPLSPGAPSLQATEASNSATAETPLSSEGVADSGAISAAAVSCADGQLAVDARANESTQTPKVAQPPADHRPAATCT
jgi:hypothetical protein